MGIFVGATGGDFELRASLPEYGDPIEVAQVDPETGDEIRSLPPEMVDGWRGLKDFLMVEFRTPEGELVAEKSIRFCPSSYARERLNDSGRNSSRYPYTECYSGFPFLRGMIWGIDDHWATPVLSLESRARRIKVPDGEYSVTVRIADPFVDFFDVAAEDTTVSLQVTVEKYPKSRRRRGHRRHPMRVAHRFEQASSRESSQVAEVTDPDSSTLPDLVALPAWGINVRNRRGRSLLTFAASPWNAGPGPLVIEGFRRRNEDTMAAYQYFYDRQGDVVGRTEVGDLEYDPRRGHEHWHFLHFASFALLDASREEIVRSKKQAFCLVNTDAVDLTVDGATWSYGDFTHSSYCGGSQSLWVRENLEAGWADTYHQSVAGQSFNITDLPNGWYYIIVEVNPSGDVLQASTSNDRELRLIHLGGKPGRRNVLVSPWNGIES